MDKRKIINKEFLWMAVVFILSFLTVFFFCSGDREVWQTAKEVGYRKGVIFSLILAFAIRRVSIKKYETWIVALVGIVGLYIYNLVKGISPATYGVNYFRVFHYTNMAYVLFAALMVDLIRDYKKVLQNINWYGLLFFIFVGWATFNCHEEFIPLICPAVAYLTSSVEKKDRTRITDLFAGAYYSVFLYMLALSLLRYSGNYEDGRFIGAFLSVATATCFCSGALLVGLYFVTRFMWAKEKRCVCGIIAGIMTIIPIFPIAFCGSRSAEFGVFFAVIGFFIVIFGKKTKKALLIRCLCLGAVLVVALGFVFTIAYKSAKEIRSGVYDSDKHDYLYNHISILMIPELRSGYFGEDSFLNVLDKFASERLKIWDASLKIVEPFGKPYDSIDVVENGRTMNTTSPHSFFIWMLVSYGGIAGVLMIVWYISGIIIAMLRCWKSDCNAVLPFLWFVFCIGPFGGITIYWQAPIAFILLLLQSSLCHRNSLRNNGNEIVQN